MSILSEKVAFLNLSTSIFPKYRVCFFSDVNVIPATYISGSDKITRVARMGAVREPYSSHTGATHEEYPPPYVSIALCMGAVCEATPPTYVSTVYGSCM